MTKRLPVAAVLIAVLAGGAWAQGPGPRSLGLKGSLKLEAAHGLPGGPAGALTVLELVQSQGRRYLAARFGPGGRPVAGRLLKVMRRRPWPELWLFAPRDLPGPWWVERGAILEPDQPAPGAQARVGLMAWGYVPAGQAVLLSGPAAAHRRRLARLQQASLPPAIKARLLAGHLAAGDNLWLVQLAWGRPQRSFMVNYLNDEQHYVYLRPGGPVLLRFQGGRLVPPLPAQAPAPVANPQGQR